MPNCVEGLCSVCCFRRCGRNLPRKCNVNANFVCRLSSTTGLNIELSNVFSKTETFEIIANTVRCSVQKHKMLEKTVTSCAGLRGAPFRGESKEPPRLQDDTMYAVFWDVTPCGSCNSFYLDD
jgi:hypothetical protein